MDLIKLLLLALCLSLSHYLVNGGRSITEEEDVEFERQLKSLNKPPIKTIQTEVGDIIDCIDIYKQPALDHPLLKNHKIQMRPTSLPKGLINDGISSADKRSRSGLRDIGCPQGTVPIRRTRKEDLIRAKSFSAANIHPNTPDDPWRHFAILRSKDDARLTYKGVQANINVYNLTVAADQSSAAELLIESGPPEELNSLKAGWIVAPQLYGDSQTRTFIHWTVDGGKKTGCFNLLCSGFVAVSQNYVIGDVIELPASTYGGDQYEIKLSIYQDNPPTGWWLTAGDEDEVVGYWPKDLLPHLVGGASAVAWGGETTTSPNGKSPPMGNGHVPKGNFNEACFVRQLHIVDPSAYSWVNPHEAQVQVHADSINCYLLDYYGYQKKGGWGHVLLFGGPGGACGP